jgi:alpha-glucosidase
MGKPTGGSAEKFRRDQRDEDFVMNHRLISWWQDGVIYQIYPRSFQDTNGDGIGDLAGIINRLSYLRDLGVDAIWLSPFFPSPMADFGYDVSEYCDVDPTFGALSDFDDLVTAAHDVGIKVIIDFVPNHTSDQHPWFVESRRSRFNSKRDWYVWRDPKPDGSPPNNWLSEFGGPAWTFDHRAGQYYYHAYLKQQPDLNWRNSDVREAMFDVLRFWLGRGVDGFRVDAIHHLYEDQEGADNPPNPEWREGMSPARQLLRKYTMDQPETHEAIRDMRRVVDRYSDRVLIGEAYLPIEILMTYYGSRLDGFHLPFNFHLMSTPWKPNDIAALIQAYESALPAGAWPNWVLGNHDRSRLASRIGSAQARVAAMLLLTLRGTPTIYQGEEIGMSDVPVPQDKVQDPWEKNVPGLGLGRDPVRTPMLWDGGTNAGFSNGQPWLPVSPNFRGQNVEQQAADPRSMLALYRALVALRRRESALSIGAYEPVDVSESILAYERRYNDQRLLVVLNLSADTVHPRCWPTSGELLQSTSMQPADRSGGHLAPR